MKHTADPVQGSSEHGMTAKQHPKTIRCPACGQATSLKENPFRPFCSRGCKGIDLIRWTSESYKIESETDHGEEDEQTET